MNHDRERFVEGILERGGVEVDEPRIGDVAIFRFGKCFSHGALIINSEEVVHAFFKSGIVLVSRRDETDLAVLGAGRRPVRYFDVAGPR